MSQQPFTREITTMPALIVLTHPACDAEREQVHIDCLNGIGGQLIKRFPDELPPLLVTMPDSLKLEFLSDEQLRRIGLQRLQEPATTSKN